MCHALLHVHAASLASAVFNYSGKAQLFCCNNDHTIKVYSLPSMERTAIIPTEVLKLFNARMSVLYPGVLYSLSCTLKQRNDERAQG